MSEEQEHQEQIESFYGEPPADINLPDMLVPPPPTTTSKVDIKDECDAAFSFAFVGAGQGGARIAETFHKLGYRKIAAVNTAEQDLNTIDLKNKLCIGKGGAGKDPAFAEKVYEESKEDVLDFLRYSLGEVFDRIFICAGAGGGSGSGTLVPLVHTSLELLNYLGIPQGQKKVGVILALPKKSEGKKVCQNAHATLSRLWPLVEQRIVSPLILLDNEKIGELYPNLVVSNFWRQANSSIAGLFHLFNLTATKDSSYSAFDANDWKTILDSGLITLGHTPIEKWDDPIAVSRAVRDQVKNNILTSGIDLRTGSCAGAIMIGGTEQLDNIPQTVLDEAFGQLSRILRPGSVVHRGIYSGDKPGLTVFTAIGGLGTPTAKMQELQ